MSKKRFSRLEDAKKKGRTGDKITAYKNWRADGRPASAPAIVAPPKGATIKKALLPFYAGSANFSTHALVKISGRSFGIIANSGLTEARLNLQDVPEVSLEGSLNSYEQIDGLSPSKVVLFVPGTGSTTVRSGITNANYKKRAGASYTLPFGKKDAPGQRDEKGMRGRILGGVNAGISVSFKEEIYAP